MSLLRKHFRRYGYALLGAAAIAGCSSSGTDNNNPGTIALALNPTSGSAAQGGQVVVAATLTRGGSFTGTVNLTVTGVPAGVTAAVSNVQTSGTTTTATVTVSVGATTLPGTFTLVVHGAGTGVTEATATYTLTVTATPAVGLALSATALTITQGSVTPTATSTVTITRTNFTGDVTLTVDNLPTGVTAAFLPVNPQTGTSSVLTLTVGPTAVPGNFTNLAVRATGASITAVTTPFTLAILSPAASFTLSLTNASLSIAQGGSTPTTTVTINRVNFPGDVALSVLNLPPGVTAAFAPANPQQGTSSVLTLTVAPTAATGTFNTLSVQGVGTAGTVATPLTLNIVAPGGTSLMFDASVCPVANRPVFVAVQDGGPSTPWQVVTPVNNVYQFTFHQAMLGAAAVTLGTGSSALRIYHLTLAELIVSGPGFCAAPPAGITVNGAVTHLTGGYVGLINFGGDLSIVTGNLSFQMAQASAGVNDLVAYMHPLPSGGSQDRGFISRGLNPGNNGSVGTVDFTGANSFAPAAASGSVTGAVGGESVAHSMRYYTGTGANACTGATLYTGSQVTGGNFIGYGVPTANQVATDFHSISITALTGISLSRSLQEDFHSFVARLASPFVLPSQMPMPAITTVVTPYKQLNLTVTMPSDLNSGAIMSQSDQTVPGKSVFVNLSGPYIGGGAATLQVPDLSALAGWNNAWVPAGGDVLAWSLSGTGVVGTACTEGHRFVASSRGGTN